MTAEPDLHLWQHGAPPEPARLMHLTAEVFPFAADRQGIWLVSGEGPWPTMPIAEDSSPVEECESELLQHGAWPALIGPHQSSGRVDNPAFITTHFAVIPVQGPVRSRWPDAKPVSPRLVDRVGKPPTHPANAAPEEVRMVDALFHALRHVAFQLTPWGDAELADKLDPHWRRHLGGGGRLRRRLGLSRGGWRPELYRLYDRVHQAG